MPSITGAHHVALAVRDVVKSEAWYADSPVKEDAIGTQIAFATSTTSRWSSGSRSARNR